MDPLLFDLACRMATARVDGVPAALTEAIRDTVKLDESAAATVARIVLDGMHAMRAVCLHHQAEEAQHAFDPSDFDDCM